MIISDRFKAALFLAIVCSACIVGAVCPLLSIKEAATGFCSSFVLIFIYSYIALKGCDYGE